MELVLKYWYLLLAIPPAILIFMMLLHMVLGRYKYGPMPQVSRPPKRGSVLKRIYWDFPKQYAYDQYHKSEDEFREYGFHLFAGEQGSGKTVAMTECIMRLKEQYPKAKIATNYNLKCEDSVISHWKDLVFKTNGVEGQMDAIDETQNWFNSAQSKDFPIEMITEITQQRKQRKVLFGTSHEFQRLAKPLREKVNYLYEPMTIAGCLTIVRVTKPLINDDGKIEKKRHHKTYFFVHDERIRDMFDTYKKIEKMANEGFAPRDFGNQYIIKQEQAKKGLFRKR